MNNKYDASKSSTEKKFKRRKKTIPFSTRLLNNFIRLKQQKVHYTARFWITNFIFICFFAKSMQFVFYIREFVVVIPKEEAMNNLMLTNMKNIKEMDDRGLKEYLDQLEQMKIERTKLQKQSKDKDMELNLNTINESREKKI